MTGKLFVREHEGQVQVSWHAPGQIAAEGGPYEPFESPLSGQDLEDLRWYLEDYLVAPYAVYEDRGREIEGRLPAWGQALFASVFGSGREGGKIYQRTAGRKDWELWIASDSAPFLALPWELLRDPDRKTPLALGISGIHRTIDAPSDAAQVPTGESLRVLMVIARPYGQKDVPYRTIARPLLSRLEPVQGRVELEVLRPPTFNALKERLRRAQAAEEPFHIVHFDGHGTVGRPVRGGSPDPLRYAADRPVGVLLFETEAGGEDPIAADDLAPELATAGVPLLVLNACRSGMLAGAEPNAAVATRLLHEGTAAVVAMGYTVYAVAAAEMMAAFYESLFAGDSVSQAVTAGRRQLHRRNLRPSPKGKLPLADWIVPVHYARREIAFPQLRRQATRGGISLDEALEKVREREQAAARPEGEGVHVEGEIDAAEGRFFGRDQEFQWLETALRTDRVVLLHGIGGTGKTELAKAFGRWLRDSGGLDHPSLVFFHSFEPGLPSFGLDGVVASVGLRFFGSDFARLDPDDRVQAVLEALRETRMLLIWDNFETVHSMPDPQGVTPTLDETERERMRRFLEAVHEKGKGGVIITSRSRESWLGEEIRRREVGGLAREDAIEYADALLAGRPEAIARRKNSPFAELMEHLAGHPLSLRLVLPRLEETEPEALLEELRNEPVPDFDEAEDGDRLRSVAASVHYSFRHLPDEDRRRLPVLSLFEGMVDADVLGLLSAQDDAPDRVRQVDTAAWVTTLDRCAAFGLLTPLGMGIYRLHPALPRYLRAVWRREARDRFEEEREATTRANIRAHAIFGDWLLRQIRGGKAEVAHTVLRVGRRNLGAAVAAALDREVWTEAQAILQPLNELWKATGNVVEAGGWTIRCREVLEGSGGKPPDLDTDAAALWLFMVGTEANRHLVAGRLGDAEMIYDDLRRALEQSAGEQVKERLAVTYHQLGMVAQRGGDLASAEKWYRRSLEIKEDLKDRPGMASSYHQLGMVAHLGGDLVAAESWYRRSLELEEELGNRPGMASSYHQLGWVAQDGGDLSSAENWYLRSLDQRGVERPSGHGELLPPAREGGSAPWRPGVRGAVVPAVAGDRGGIGEPSGHGDFLRSARPPGGGAG